MATERTTKILDHTIDPCPKCTRKHHYKLKVIMSAERVSVFGGPGAKSEVFFICPDTHERFTERIDNPLKGEIMGVATETDIKLYILYIYIESMIWQITYLFPL